MEVLERMKTEEETKEVKRKICSNESFVTSFVARLPTAADFHRIKIDNYVMHESMRFNHRVGMLAETRCELDSQL